MIFPGEERVIFAVRRANSLSMDVVERYLLIFREYFWRVGRRFETARSRPKYNAVGGRPREFSCSC